MASLSIITTFVRRWFNRAFNNGEEMDYSALDAQLADIVLQGNQNKARLEAISTAAGSLRYAVTQSTRFTATASQTAFTLPTYDHTNDLVAAYTNSGSGLLTRIDDNLVVKTSDTVVTLPAQAVSATVIIEVRSAGNGTSQLASTTTGQGAGLIGYANVTALGTQATVEGALDEIYESINSPSFLEGVLTLSGYLKADGSVPLTGDLDADGSKITGLGAGSAASNDAARMADITPAALQTGLGAFLSATFLPLAGGTMSGDIAFTGGAGITGLPAAAASGEPLTFDQINSFYGSGKNSIINGIALVQQGTDYAATVSGTYDYGKADMCKGALTGTTVSGTLTQSTAVTGMIGGMFLWNTVTTTGSGIASWRFYIEAKDAARFKNKKGSLSFKFYSTGAIAVSVAASVSKANGVDDFSSVTLISTSPAAAAAPSTVVSVSLADIDMGDCSLGIQIDIAATIGAVTNKSFSVGEVQFEPGSVATTIEFEAYHETLHRCKRYLEVFGGASEAIAAGQATTTSVAKFFLAYVTKRAAPGITVTGANFTVTKADGSSQAVSAGGAASTGVSSTLISMTASAATLVAGNGCLLIGTGTAGITVSSRF